MRFSSWFDKGTSTFVAATRQCMFMVAVAALALGWATTAAAYDELSKTGQTSCYQLERYTTGPLGPDPVTGEPGQVVVRDANGNTESDPATGEPNPAFDPATGAVSDPAVACAGTGQDGASQKGIARTRINKGDGRIYDNNTGLTWEKKSDDDSIHDKDNTYTWEEALAYVQTLNNICQKNETLACATNADCAAVGGVCGFAGKRDWRLPNVRELSSLVNWGVFTNFLVASPTIWPEFNTNCVPGVSVLTGSCTHADALTNDEHNDFVAFGTEGALRVPFTYWASTSGDAPGDAWFVDFFTGDSGAHFKDVDVDIDPQIDLTQPPGPANTEVIFAGHVRAVRGASDDDPAPKPAPAPKPPKKKK